MTLKQLRWLLFFAGLAIGLLMVLRSQAHRDQFFLLILGWELVENGRLFPFGPHVSGGGLYPGYLAGLFSGLPLLIWQDYRSPALLVLVLRAAAYLGLDRALRDHLDDRERLLLCALFWLSPWSLHYAGFIWAPNWTFFFGVAHFWTAFRQRTSASFLDSYLHVLAIGAVFQFHGSFLLLAVVSGLLVLRGYMKVRWSAVVAGAATVFFSTLPWLLLAARNPLVRPGGEGYLGHGLIAFHPLVKGLAYWFRYPSMWFPFNTLRFDFTPALGPQADAVLTPVMFFLTWVVGSPTVFVCLAAFIWYWRRRPPAVFGRVSPEATAREWLVGFTRWTFLGSLVTFALIPTPIMSWQGFVILHVAVLPTVFFLAEHWRRAAPRWTGKAIAVHVTLLGLISLAMALGSPMFRQGGRFSEYVRARQLYPVLVELGVDRNATVIIDAEKGYSDDPMEHAVRED